MRCQERGPQSVGLQAPSPQRSIPQCLAAVNRTSESGITVISRVKP